MENQHFWVQAATATATAPPPPVAVAVAGWGIWPHGIGFSNGLVHNRSKVSGSWAEIFSVMSNIHESGWLVRFEVWEFFFGLEINQFWGSDFWSGSF